MLTIAEKIENRKSEIKNPLHIFDCGLADYRQVLEQQHSLHKKRLRNKIPDTVLITEHLPVITLGTRKNANKLLTTSEYLTKKHIDVVQTLRAGGTTAHNPGQLVFYPILNLRQLGLTITEYIRTLEQIGMELLSQLGIQSQRKKSLPGLWLDNKKIASIGVRVSKSVTCHGMAINIQNDLSIFDFIIPCGLDDAEITSACKQTGKQYSINKIKESLAELLDKYFSPSNKILSTIYNQHDTNKIRDTRHETRKLPPWLRRPLTISQTYNRTENLLNSLGLQTICTNANCPNKGICWDKGSAAVLILGKICTRNCKFCSVPTGKPEPPDPTEPHRIAKMAEKMKLKYLVLTSVNRDDLPNGGAVHFRDCINEMRKNCPDIKFEILTPDFHHCQAKAVEILADVLPFVFAHNLETVPSLYPFARPAGNYQRSLNLLKIAKQNYPNTPTKSSIILGLGETDAQVEQLLIDLRNIGCNRITIGQYLKPSKSSLDVIEYIPPQKFDFWKQKAINLGFSQVHSEPFARSSFLAEQQNSS